MFGLSLTNTRQLLMQVTCICKYYATSLASYTSKSVGYHLHASYLHLQMVCIKSDTHYQPLGIGYTRVKIRSIYPQRLCLFFVYVDSKYFVYKNFFGKFLITSIINSL